MSKLSTSTADSNNSSAERVCIARMNHINTWKQVRPNGSKDCITWLPSSHKISKKELTKLLKLPIVAEKLAKKDRKQKGIEFQIPSMYVKCGDHDYEVASIKIDDISKPFITCSWPIEWKEGKKNEPPAKRKRERSVEEEPEDEPVEKKKELPQDLRLLLNNLKDEVERLALENQELKELMNRLHSQNRELTTRYRNLKTATDIRQDEDSRVIWKKMNALKQKIQSIEYID
ncbi:hypothetical protein CAEBREN_06218 [Caenorhabditis brenneri]|uniref:Uncharacterized protein n=1 Tax=Caenorhabditis brenneri TaxID=135651 RepID=G0MEN0_CAEBE|nr:hypothetical protein CAEBREN_06218 [Caenorhabditis brenneri]